MNNALRVGCATPTTAVSIPIMLISVAVASIATVTVSAAVKQAHVPVMQAPANQQQQAAQVQATAIAVATAPMAHVNRQPHALHKTIVHLTVWFVMVDIASTLHHVIRATIVRQVTLAIPAKTLLPVFLMAPQNVLRIHNVRQEATVNSSPTHAKVAVETTMTVAANVMVLPAVDVTAPIAAQRKVLVIPAMRVQAMQIALAVQSVHKTTAWNV